MKRLREQAEKSGGVPFSAVTAARDAEPSIYARLGRDRLAALSEAFYTRVYAGADNEKDGGEHLGWFRELFSNATRAQAVERQQLFFAQEFGGPRDFEKARGAPMLLGRHGPYAIGAAAARQWLRCMGGALDDVGVQGDTRALLDAYFTAMAWYIVHGRELVNGQRQVGYFGRHAEGDV